MAGHAPGHFRLLWKLFAARRYAVGSAFLMPRVALYFFSNRSMRPAVSISFWRPVKNGWQDEQISTRMSPLCVERVLKVWEQAQVTLISLYAG